MLSNHDRPDWEASVPDSYRDPVIAEMASLTLGPRPTGPATNPFPADNTAKPGAPPAGTKADSQAAAEPPSARRVETLKGVEQHFCESIAIATPRMEGRAVEFLRATVDQIAERLFDSRLATRFEPSRESPYDAESGARPDGISHTPPETRTPTRTDVASAYLKTLRQTLAANALAGRPAGNALVSLAIARVLSGQPDGNIERPDDPYEGAPGNTAYSGAEPETRGVDVPMG